MILKNLFKKKNKNNPNKAAQERLTLILAHERTANIEFIDDLRKDLLKVIEKYSPESNVSFKTNSHNDISSLEIEIKL